MKKILTALSAIFAFALISASAASAQSLQADLGSLNDSGVTGTATVTIDGSQATVNVDANGTLEGSPHAMHIHIGGEGVCPTADADSDGDGIVTVADGLPSYGEVKVSLTTKGDTSANSALAVERFPTDGNISYSRTFDLPKGVSGDDVASGVVVVHGIDANGNGEYDGDAGESSLDPELPLEATAPAACGKLTGSQTAAAGGGVETGLGGTSGSDNAALIGIGFGLLALAGGMFVLRRRVTE